jgi:hypothetical protein
MSRRTVFLGAATQRPVDIRGPRRRSWPDIDSHLVQQQIGLEELDGARAITLGYDSDWDLVRVVFMNTDDAEQLGPGRVLNCCDGNGRPRRIARIEPIMPAPATRLYDATGLRRGLPPAFDGGGTVWPDLSPLFYARLAIDVFDTCPPPNYEPELAPARYISLADFVVGAGTSASAGPPKLPPQQPLITIPVVNARGVEFLFRNTGGSVLHALLVSPSATDAIDDVGGVWNTDPDHPPEYAVVGPDESGSLVLDRPRHPYVKILVGSDTGAIVSDAVLSVNRELDR